MKNFQHKNIGKKLFLTDLVGCFCKQFNRLKSNWRFYYREKANFKLICTFTDLINSLSETLVVCGRL